MGGEGRGDADPGGEVRRRGERGAEEAELERGLACVRDDAECGAGPEEYLLWGVRRYAYHAGAEG